MRPKLVIGVLLLAVGLAGVLALMSKTFRPQSSIPSTGIEKGVPVESPSTGPQDRQAATPSITPPASAAPSKVTNTPAPVDPAHAKYVRQRIDELDALAMNDDAASRDAILSEMRNPDKAIRKGALEAAIQFGDRSVVPTLKEIAAQTDDPAEKADILAAIDYINLPSLTEYLSQRNAAGLTNTLQISTNRSGHRPRRQAPRNPQGGN